MSDRNSVSDISDPAGTPHEAVEQQSFTEQVTVEGHIIDSLILPRVLDCITQAGATFRIQDISVGHGRHDPSHAVLEVSATSGEHLADILSRIHEHGAVPVESVDCAIRDGGHRRRLP